MKDQYTLKYYGKEADTGQMGYYDAASMILAFGDFIGIVSRAAFGKDAKLKISVAALKEGSLSFDFFLVSGSIITAIIGHMSPNELWNLVRDSVEAWKFLRGKPPTEVTNEKEGARITNINGDCHTFNQNVTLVIENPRAGESVERIFNKPLNDSASRVDISSSQVPGEKIEVNSDDAKYFVDLLYSKVQGEYVHDITLNLISPVFADGNKWKFNDGAATFSAAIEDEGFLRRVNEGESFSKGDLLIVKCHFLQEMVNGKLKVTRTITEVLDHKRRPINNDLFIE